MFKKAHSSKKGIIARAGSAAGTASVGSSGMGSGPSRDGGPAATTATCVKPQFRRSLGALCGESPFGYGAESTLKNRRRAMPFDSHVFGAFGCAAYRAQPT
jgi:hypothetical protein